MAENDNNYKLGVSFGLDSSEFTEGVAKIRQKLTELNTQFEENKQKISGAAKEIKSLRKEQEELEKEIKKSGGATEEQKTEMQALTDKIS